MVNHILFILKQNPFKSYNLKLIKQSKPHKTYVQLIIFKKTYDLKSFIEESRNSFERTLSNLMCNR